MIEKRHLHRARVLRIIRLGAPFSRPCRGQNPIVRPYCGRDQALARWSTPSLLLRARVGGVVLGEGGHDFPLTVGMVALAGNPHGRGRDPHCRFFWCMGLVQRSETN